MRTSLIMLLTILAISSTALFVRADTLELVSNNANSGSGISAVSSDGRYVAFLSWATNLVDNDTNNLGDVFIRDLWTGEVKRVNVDSNGIEANYAYHTEYSIFSERPAISADGEFVAFISNSTNLVYDDTNNATDIFVHDTTSGETSRVSLDLNGAQFDNPSKHFSMSGDGRYVAFNIHSSYNFEQNGIYIHDRQTGTTSRVPISQLNPSANGITSLSLSADGSYLAFFIYSYDPVTYRTSPKVYVYDTVNSTFKTLGRGKKPSISADGRFVTYLTDPGGWLPSYVNVYDLATDEIEQLPYIESGNLNLIEGQGPRISGDGRFVAYRGNLNYYGAGLIYDRQLDKPLVLPSIVYYTPDISADGMTITFTTYTSLLDADQNMGNDVYAYNRDQFTTDTGDQPTTGTDDQSSTETGDQSSTDTGDQSTTDTGDQPSTDTGYQPCEKLDLLVNTLAGFKSKDNGQFVTLGHLALDACENGADKLTVKKLEILIAQLKRSLDNKNSNNSIDTQAAILIAESTLNDF